MLLDREQEGRHEKPGGNLGYYVKAFEGWGLRCVDAEVGGKKLAVEMEEPQCRVLGDIIEAVDRV